MQPNNMLKCGVVLALVIQLLLASFSAEVVAEAETEKIDELKKVVNYQA